MSRASAQIEKLAEGGIALWLGGAPAAVVPGAEDAAWIARLVESVDDERGQRLMLAGIVAGIALAAPPHPSAARGAAPSLSPEGEGKGGAA